MRNLQTGNSTIIRTSINSRAAKWGAIFALAFGLTAAAYPTAAQQAAPQQDSTQQAGSPTNSSGDVPVHMVVTVQPRHGGDAPALAADDVKVFQRKSQDTVTGWVPLQGDRAGLQLFILIDDSARATLALQYSSLVEFIKAQPASTAIGVGYMRNGTVFTAQNLTNDHALAAKALRLPIGNGAYASPYLSLGDLMKRWPESSDRRESLMITSGIDPLGGGCRNDPYTNPDPQTAG